MKFYESMMNRLHLAAQSPSLAMPKSCCSEIEKYCSTYIGHGIVASGVLIAIYTFKKLPSLFYISVTLVVLRALNFLLFQFFHIKDPNAFAHFESSSSSFTPKASNTTATDPKPEKDLTPLKTLLNNFQEGKASFSSFPEYLKGDSLLKQYLKAKEDRQGLSLCLQTLPASKEEEKALFDFLCTYVPSVSQLEICGWGELDEERLGSLQKLYWLKSLVLPDVKHVEVNALKLFKHSHPSFSLLDVHTSDLSHSTFEGVGLCVLCNDHTADKVLQELQKNVQDYIHLSGKESSQDIDGFFQSLHHQYPSFLPQLHTLELEGDDQSSLSDLQMQHVLINLNYYFPGLEKISLKAFLSIGDGFFERLAHTPLCIKKLHLEELSLFNYRCLDHLMTLSSLKEIHLQGCGKIKEKVLIKILKHRKNEAIKSEEFQVIWEGKTIELSEDSNLS